MPCPLLIFSQSDYLIQVVDINFNTEWQTVQIQISWLLKNWLLLKPTDLDLHCLQRQGISEFSRTRGNISLFFHETIIWYPKNGTVDFHHFRRIIIFVTSHVLSCTPSPFEKGSPLKEGTFPQKVFLFPLTLSLPNIR